MPLTAAGDAIEREAELIAHRVLHAEDEVDRARPAFLPLREVPLPSNLPPAVQRALARPGSPLSSEIRRFFEGRFGRRLDRVRIYDSEAAAVAARMLRGNAITVGQHVLFGAWQYAPRSPIGRQLLAHELAHVLQQAQYGVTALARQQVSGTDPSGVVDEPVGGTPLRLKRGQGWGYLYVPGDPEIPERRWATFEWDARYDNPLHIDFVPSNMPQASVYGLRVTSDVSLVATLDRTLEERRSSSGYTLFSYDFRFSGTLDVDGERLRTPRIYTKCPGAIWDWLSNGSGCACIGLTPELASARPPAAPQNGRRVAVRSPSDGIVIVKPSAIASSRSRLVVGFPVARRRNGSMRSASTTTRIA